MRPRLRRAAAAVLISALAGCGDGGGFSRETTSAIEVRGVKPGITRTEYMAMPDSARLDVKGDDGSLGTGPGAAVEVDITLDGFARKRVPLAYSLHDAATGQQFRKTTTSLVPDAPRWRRLAHLWVDVPAPGTYYVQVVLGDSAGHRSAGPRTLDFTVQ